MKTRALAVDKITGKSKYVTAFDAIYLRESDKEKYKKLAFYYEGVDGSNTKLIPKYLSNKNTAFFAFESAVDTDGIFSDEGESITHFVAKKALSEMKKLYLIDVYTKEEYLFDISHSENEKRFDFDNLFFVDVYCELNSTQHRSMQKYFYKWKEKLILEVCVTHRVDDNKRNEFYNNGYSVFEIQIPPSTRKKFNLENDGKISKARIERAINNMKKMFEKGVRGVFISDPETEEYSIMMKYKDEIEKFRQVRDKAEKECIEAENKLECVNFCLGTAEKNKKYYDSIESKVAKLESKVVQLEKEIEYSRRHPLRHFLSCWKKGKRE